MRIRGSFDSSLLFKSGIVAGAVILATLAFTDAFRATGQESETPLKKAEPVMEPFVELAPYMGELQRLTHKLSLSVSSGNYRLASFYLYESLESLEDMKTDVPEYRGLPVALLIDQLTTPRYEAMKKALKEDEAAGKLTHSPAAFTAIVNSCNECHVATQHGFIKITNRSDFNPFNQDFKP